MLVMVSEHRHFSVFNVITCCTMENKPPKLKRSIVPVYFLFVSRKIIFTNLDHACHKTDTGGTFNYRQ